jgi:hypothetical protein
MKRPGDFPLVNFSNFPPTARRPERVANLRGIILQSDARSLIGALFIRPIESFDRWLAGLDPLSGHDPLPMHAGVHVTLEDGREFVAEQLVGTLFEDFKDALNWTPLQSFREREGAGWDVTVPADQFRGIAEGAITEAVENLNSVQGHAFLGEDCTMFVERVFGGRRLFGDSPTGHALGLSLRVGDPALPLLRADAALDDRASRLLRAEALRNLRDPVAAYDAPNARIWLGRVIVWSVVGTLLGGAIALVRWIWRPRHR